ncbi:hypothetical protein KBC79_02905 [Candidatus Woesebacteria bacterium]|nr:hypothetical protein [Candidatus Woesebacteria bacterium]
MRNYKETRNLGVIHQPPEFSEEASPSFLLTALQSEKFQKALHAAASETMRSGAETSFWVLVDAKKMLVIPEVLKGGLSQMGGEVTSETILEIDEYNWYSFVRDAHALYITLHFHPDDDTLPSRDDLESNFSDRLHPAEMFTYMVVATVDSRGTVSLLMVERPSAGLISEDLDEYEEASAYTIGTDHRQIIKILEKFGLAAHVVELKKKTMSSRRYELATEPEKILNHFENSTLFFGGWFGGEE